ncbi:MAG: toxic anion resistance protein [Methylococcaceae bacterium]
MSIPDTLTPPEPLTPPETVTPVAPERAAGMIKLAPAQLSELDGRVDEFLNIILSHDIHTDTFKNRVKGVHTLGDRDIKAASDISSRLLEQPMRAMEAGVFDKASGISRALLDLRNTIEELDPARQGNLLEPRKLLGILPMGNKAADYFRQYQSAESHLKAIMEALYNGQDELRKDNAAVEEEKVNAWRVMERLEQYIYLGQQIDAALITRLDQMERDNPEKARIVREEVLFYVRQKVQDLLTQLAVTIQGYLAMDMIRKNNLELIKGVDRATSTTISALRTAVIVAQALVNQKLVLDQVTALSTTTGNMIESTSALLKQQAGRIHEQAAAPALGLEQLQLAFRNVYDTMDMVASYKLTALDNMQKTVDILGQEVTRSKTDLDRVRNTTTDEFTL